RLQCPFICLCCVCVSPAVVLTSCDFNQGHDPYCRFSQDNTDNGDWTRHKEYTSLFCLILCVEGYYIYHECDNVANGQKARLLSPVLTSSASEICVQFRYYMYGMDSHNILRVLAKTPSGDEEVWNKTGIQSPSWLKGSITVHEWKKMF
uniref:MAM domain-containing protein n=1 Tax=Monopterus albus TaxID=43700 RepID=A0A3Q3J1L2_MONAL